MKLSVTREAWLPALQGALGAVDRKQAVPILGNLLVKATGDQVHVWGTDLEVEVRVSSPAEVQVEGETTLPARKLWEIWRSLPVGAMAEVAVSGGRATIRSGSSRFTLATLEPQSFPVGQDFEPLVSVSLPASAFKGMLEHVHFAMAQQDVRYYLNGLLLEIGEGRFRAVATDGHRLACCDTTAPDQSGEVQQAIVPRKAVGELLRLGAAEGDHVSIEVGVQSLRVSIGEVRLTARLVEGRFPEYERVIPDPAVWDKHVLVDREELRQSLARAAILANERYRAVRLSATAGRLAIQSENAEREQVDEELDVEYTGLPVVIGFNVTYLMDAVSAVPEERVRLCLNDENSSCLVLAEHGTACRYVVMPMRL
ncbi:MAG: DNA polymerase III subunit beta [Gammaproteobacteria bacterium]|nr:DNA polymerase III subunit beta [Gammaproteobacteria bacterium]